MGMLEKLAAKLMAARDRLLNLEGIQKRLSERASGMDERVLRLDDDLRRQFAALEKEIAVARREFVLAEQSLSFAAARGATDHEEAGKTARAALDKAYEEREARLTKLAGKPGPTDPPVGGGQGPGTAPSVGPQPQSVEDARRELREGLLKAGVLPAEDWRTLAEVRNKALEEAREAERQRRLDDARDRKELEAEIPDPDVSGR